MALIPLKDTVVIARQTGESDPWGGGVPAVERTAYKCRIDEATEVVRDQLGKEVVVNTQIMLEGAVAVSYNDDIEWVGATGVAYTRKPVAIEVLKDLASKPLFTVVSV